MQKGYIDFDIYLGPADMLVKFFNLLLIYITCSTYLSAAIATKCKIDAVQQRTSQEVHISQTSGPSLQPLLIYAYAKERQCTQQQKIK